MSRSVQPSLTDPSEPSKASLPLLKHASTTQSASMKKSVTIAMPNEPTSAELPKGTGASTQSSVTPKDSTKLPPIAPKDAGVNLPAELPPLKSKKTGPAKLPTKLPPIEMPPEQSPEKSPAEKSPLKKSPTWPPLFIEPQLPAILPRYSSKKPSKDSTATMPPIDYGTMPQPKDSDIAPLLSSVEVLSTEQDTMQLKTAEEKLQILQISPQVSPEKAGKEIIKPVNIAEGDPEMVSGYN